MTKQASATDETAWIVIDRFPLCIWKYIFISKSYPKLKKNICEGSEKDSLLMVGPMPSLNVTSQKLFILYAEYDTFDLLVSKLC